MPYRGQAKRRSFRISPNKFGWLKAVWGQLDVYIFPTLQDAVDEGEDPNSGWMQTQFEELGPVVRLHFRKNQRPYPLSIDLTQMSVDELENFRSLVNQALDLAKPVCALRDQEAKHALATGDDSISRNYRPISELVTREGALTSYRESLQHGLESLTERIRGIGDRPPGAGTDSDELAEREPETDSTKDDRETTDGA